MLNKLYIRIGLKLSIKIMAILILYQFSRLFFFFYNFEYFSNIYLIDYLRIIKGSIRFDISAILYVNSLVILLSLIPSNLLIKRWYKNVIYYLFIYCNLLGIAVNIIDIFYYPFSKSRLTTSFLNEFSNEKSIFRILVEFFKDYWFTIPLLIIVFYILKVIANKTEIESKTIYFSKKNIFTSSIICLLYLTLVVFGLRGTFVLKNWPITISNAGKYTNNPNEISLIINTPFSLIRTYNLKDLKRKKYFKDSDLEKYTNIVKLYKSEKETKKNVIVIILESVSTEYFRFYNSEPKDYIGYTPFLDSLINHSYTSYNSFANGTKSVDAIPSILASIPATEFHFSLSKYCANKIDGIGSLLNKEGYQTSFFHGAPNGSMGFESMSKLLGIKNYYGMDNYKNKSDFDGVWGIWDDKFFNYFADELNDMKEPFFSSIFSCSSHHPYKIPKEFNNKFKKGKHPMHECVQYTDHSLKLFFNKIKHEPWFKNTLFVITADHTNISFEKKYRSPIGIFRVPIIFYDPSNINLNQKSEKIIQQIDIMPSILSYLDYNKPFLSLGNNIFNSENGFAINYNNGFQMIIDERVVIYNELEEEITKIFDFTNDISLKQNIINDIESIMIEQYKYKIQSFIQTYNNRMIDNKLSFEN
jgi:phosphoglycerol transferase MdoB-like AlkP superfamily enzyme